MSIDDLDQDVLWRLNAFVSDLPSGRLPDGAGPSGGGHAGGAGGGGGLERGGGGGAGASEQNDEVAPCLPVHCLLCCVGSSSESCAM